MAIKKRLSAVTVDLGRERLVLWLHLFLFRLGRRLHTKDPNNFTQLYYLILIIKLKVVGLFFQRSSGVNFLTLSFIFFRLTRIILLLYLFTRWIPHIP